MLFLFLISLLILAGVWAFFVEPYMIKVEKLTLLLEKENLPPSFKNLKFVHLTDLHSKNFGKKEKKVLNILDQLKPDFIFITGDIVDWTTRNFKSCQRFWHELTKNYQGRVFAVFGNHEHLNPRFKELLPLLRESGIEVLNNQAKEITIKEVSFYLIGVDDPHFGYDDIEKAMQGVGNEGVKILLAHSPEIFRKVKGKNINVVLTGHTHAGQVNIPLLVDLILPLKYDRKYKKGLFKEKNTYLYVNRGIGTTILPVRFNSLPEITLINFK